MIYCFDIDGVICNNEPEGDYLNRKPNTYAIEKLNRLYEQGHYIKIFTSRGVTTGIDWRNWTEKQLENWGVKHHELIMGKPHADVVLDDKAINIKEWLK